MHLSWPHTVPVSSDTSQRTMTAVLNSVVQCLVLHLGQSMEGKYMVIMQMNAVNKCKLAQLSYIQT